MIRTNARGEVILPFFRVGVEELDLAAMLDALRKGAKAAQ
jgi:hypothetical protein